MASPAAPRPLSADERALDYPVGREPPAPGTTRAVAPGILWARMGLPFALDHINVWLLRDAPDPAERGPAGTADGWTLVDCGIDDARTRADWDAVFASEALGGLPVVRVVVTHMHPDHIGLAHWLCERWGARLWISGTDHAIARRAIGDADGSGGPPAARFMASHGLVDAASQQAVLDRASYYRSLVPAVPAAHRRLLDGSRVAIGPRGDRAAWRCHAGFGHAPEHIALDAPDRGVLISGDMVLPRISTNVSVYDPEPEADALALYLGSLERMRAAIAPDVLVLPSHGVPFRGLHVRIDQLVAHHRARLEETLAACRAAPTSARDLVPVLFRRPLDLHQMTFALGEALAHLHLLWFEGRLERASGDDGIFRFTAA
jgi:glyoxylase-like metal-dependent hydrolase (beta-lactamase superfamily II)